MENYAGRDLTDLRSRSTGKGDVPVAWVPDDVMRTTLKELKQRDFADYARPRPSDPKSLGVRAELTVYDDRGRARTILRRHGQALKEAEAFHDCAVQWQSGRSVGSQRSRLWRRVFWVMR